MSAIGNGPVEKNTVHARAGVGALSGFGPARLPVRAGGQGMGAVGRLSMSIRRHWVLHRIHMVRVGIMVLAALIIAGGISARGGIVQAAVSAGDLMSGRFASLGFGISEIAITGQSLASEREIAAALRIDETTNILNFDVAAARRRILDIAAISDVSVRKVYPSRLVVQVDEVAPVARWRVDGITFVIDGAGRQIASGSRADSALPLVIGDGAADDARIIISALDRHPLLKERLLAYSRIADRRWDLIYDTGLRVQLPESGVEAALSQLEAAQKDAALLDRDLVLIDMRVPDLVALRPAQRNETDS